MAEDILIPIPEIPPEASDDIFYRSESMRNLKEILKDEVVEQKLKDFEIWSIISKTYKLTFFEERDVRVQENLFEAEVCKLLRSVPPCLHTPELYQLIGQARMIFHANLRRSLGTVNRNKLNERTAQISQFRQVWSSNQFSGDGGGIRSFFNRLVGRK